MIISEWKGHLFITPYQLTLLPHQLLVGGWPKAAGRIENHKDTRMLVTRHVHMYTQLWAGTQQLCASESWSKEYLLLAKQSILGNKADNPQFSCSHGSYNILPRLSYPLSAAHGNCNCYHWHPTLLSDENWLLSNKYAVCTSMCAVHWGEELSEPLQLGPWGEELSEPLQLRWGAVRATTTHTLTTLNYATHTKPTQTGTPTSLCEVLSQPPLLAPDCAPLYTQTAVRQSMYGGSTVTLPGRGKPAVHQYVYTGICTPAWQLEHLMRSSLSELYHALQLLVLCHVACVLVTSVGEEAVVCDLESFTRSRISCNARFVSSSSSSS